MSLVESLVNFVQHSTGCNVFEPLQKSHNFGPIESPFCLPGIFDCGPKEFVVYHDVAFGKPLLFQKRRRYVIFGVGMIL